MSFNFEQTPKTSYKGTREVWTFGDLMSVGGNQRTVDDDFDFLLALVTLSV